MLTFIMLLMLAVLPFVLLTVFAGVNTLPSIEYEMVANDRARSVLYETGQEPEVVRVIGRQVIVRSDELDVSDTLRRVREDRRWRKAMIEQTMVNICITLMTQCGNSDVDFLWAFMPNENGAVSEILAGPFSSNLNCASATVLEYAKYGRHLFRETIPEKMLSEVTEDGVMNYHYSRPANGAGCSFYDTVDLR